MRAEDDDGLASHVEGEYGAICSGPFCVLNPCLSLDVPKIAKNREPRGTWGKFAAGEGAADEGVGDIDDEEAG